MTDKGFLDALKDEMVAYEKIKGQLKILKDENTYLKCELEKQKESMNLTTERGYFPDVTIIYELQRRSKQYAGKKTGLANFTLVGSNGVTSDFDKFVMEIAEGICNQKTTYDDFFIKKVFDSRETDYKKSTNNEGD